MRFRISTGTGRLGRENALSALGVGQGPLPLSAAGHPNQPRIDQRDDAVSNRELVLAAFETTYDQVVRYIALRIGDRDQAEDLASEVFVKALKKADSYKPEGKPIQAWLFRIAHNLLVDHLRKRTRNRPAVSLSDVGDIPIDDDTDERMQQQDELSMLNEAMSGLTEAERQVLSMRFSGEMRAEEIGTALGKSAGAVRWLQHSAVTKLRKRLNLDPDLEHGK